MGIPERWRVAREASAPGCFEEMGRDAVVISDWSGEQTNVLWALPAWAVDDQRVQTLIDIARSGCVPLPLTRMCRLWSTLHLEVINTVVCQFRQPDGVPLSALREMRSEGA